MDNGYEYAYSPNAGMLKILAISQDDGWGNTVVAGDNGGRKETWTFKAGDAGYIGYTIYIDKPIVRRWQKG